MKWQRQEDWVGSSVDGSFVMLNLEDGSYIALNQTAAEVWDCLAEPRDEDELVAALTERFEVAPADCREAVRTLIGDLSDRKLIQLLAA